MQKEVKNPDQPIVEYFKIEGLNGYKNLQINFQHGIKIVAAENGAGKTTLLNSLNSILTQKYNNLLTLDFRVMKLKLNNVNEIQITKAEISPFGENVDPIMFETSTASAIMRHGISIKQLIEATNNIAHMSQSDFMDTEVFRRYWSNNDVDRSDSYKHFTTFLNFVLSESDSFERITSLIKSALGNIEVLYLPTYRRVEAQIPEFQSTPNRRKYSRRSARSENDWDNGKLLFFGLNDVDQKLQNITNQIQGGTFEAYSKISGRTLDQLLFTGVVETNIDNETFNLENLKVVLARLGKSDDRTIARLSEIMNAGSLNSNSNKYLVSFLNQMLEVYQATQVQEEAIEKFVKLIDSYWDNNSEEKHFIFDKLEVQAKIINTYTSEKLSLNDLSSGEKQIVSVFARLCLNPDKKYIVLIDEPELSLSLSWQRRFLVDVWNSISCTQLVAITHSPFVFENELDKYAGSISVSYNHQTT